MMRIVDLQQGSSGWLAWRKTGLGGSDAVHLVGGPSWANPRNLWLEKTGQSSTPFKVTSAMARGTRLEPEARRVLNDVTGHDFAPCCVMHDTYDWLKASLDGLTSDGTLIAEIKCMGEANHKKALRGKYPDYYFAQMQHEMMAANVEMCLFVAYSPDFPTHLQLKVISVPADREYQDRLFKLEQRQQYAIERRQWPPPSPPDWNPGELRP